MKDYLIGIGVVGGIALGFLLIILSIPPIDYYFSMWVRYWR